MYEADFTLISSLENMTPEVRMGSFGNPGNTAIRFNLF